MTTHLKPKPAGTPTWVDLATPNADAARAFYKAVFGWDYDVANEQFGGYTTARVGNRTSAGIAPTPPDMSGVPVAWSLYFASDDVDADVARAVSLGAKVLYPAMVVGDFGTMATLADPTGAQFSFWKAGSHIGSQINDEPGAVGWYELYSSDAKRARDFYTALLNLSSEPMPGGMEYYVLKRGDQQLAGIMNNDPTWGMPSQWGIYFIVANTDQTVETIAKQGGKILSQPENTPFGRMSAVADAQGALFKVIQSLAG